MRIIYLLGASFGYIYVSLLLGNHCLYSAVPLDTIREFHSHFINGNDSPLRQRESLFPHAFEATHQMEKESYISSFRASHVVATMVDKEVMLLWILW